MVGWAAICEVQCARAILVVGNTDNPSTSYPNSQAMATPLGTATVLAVDGYGHAEPLNPGACANGHIAGYLIDGTLPPDGTTCQQDKASFAAC